MRALRSLSAASRPGSPTSRSRRSSSRTPEPQAPPPKPTSAFAFTQINVANFDRAEAFFEKVFGWRFVGEPTSPAFIPPAPAPTPAPASSVLRDAMDPSSFSYTAPVKMAPPIAPPPDHRVNYFTPKKEVGQGHIAGGLFKFGPESKAVNFGGRGRDRVVKKEGEGGGGAADEDGGTKIPSVIDYVAVEDIAVALNAVRLAGGKTVVKPWTERDEMARFALFEDTEGNVFGLIQYLM